MTFFFFFSFEIQITENDNPEENWAAKLFDGVEIPSDIYIHTQIHV